MDNSGIITKAFAGLRAAKDSACREALRKLMSDAMALALDLHDGIGTSDILLHLAVGDDYGWAVYHGGELADMEVYTAGGDHRGIVASRLREMAGGLFESGGTWMGVVMAGMKVMHYNFGHERDILSATAKDAAQKAISTFIRNYRRT